MKHYTGFKCIIFWIRIRRDVKLASPSCGLLAQTGQNCWKWHRKWPENGLNSRLCFFFERLGDTWQNLVRLGKKLVKLDFRHIIYREKPLLVAPQSWWFWWDKDFIVRVPKNTLSCGREIFCLLTKNHHDFLVGPKSLWSKKWRRQRWDTKQPHSDTKITDTKTRRQPQRCHNNTRQQRPSNFVFVGTIVRGHRDRGATS